jgi:hypothetical protein
MRAREFIAERKLFVIPGLSSGDPYQTYRVGIAIARARSEVGDWDRVRDGQKRKDGEFSGQSPFGENSIIIPQYEDGSIIDTALEYVGITGGKRENSMSSGYDLAPDDNPSPIKAFRGYKRK